MVGRRVVEVDGLLDQPQAKRPGVELDVLGRVAGDHRAVMQGVEAHLDAETTLSDMWAQGGVRGAAIAFVCVLLGAASAHASGTYTHVVCADATTGRGVDADGRLPSGMTSTSGHTVGAD